MATSGEHTQAADLPEQKRFSYTGTNDTLFRLLFRNTWLTMLSLGIYRFWAKTRERQFYWSHTKLDSIPLEYNGTGLEKLIGFTIGVVVVACIFALIGLLDLVTFAIIGAPYNEYISVLISFILVPPMAYAHYLAYKYRISRTSFRGIKFSVQPAAMPYCILATWNSLLVVLTLGIWFPRMQMALEKFRIRHTRYGTLSMQQNATVKELYKCFLPMLVVMLTIAAYSGYIYYSSGIFTAMEQFETTQAEVDTEIDTDDITAEDSDIIIENYDMDESLYDFSKSLTTLTLLLSMLYLAWLYFKATSTRVFINGRSIAQTILFTSELDFSTILGCYITGTLAIGAICIIASILVATAFFTDTNINKVMLVATAMVMLITTPALWGIMIRQKIIQHVWHTMTISGYEKLDTALQTGTGGSIDAEGASSALDIDFDMGP